MKKIQILSLYFLSWVVLFFFIFLHPIFAVRLFSSPTAYGFFRFLSGITSLVGVVGMFLYFYVFYIAFKTKQLQKPILWLQLSLLVVSSTMVVVFLIPLTISPY